MSNLKFHVVDVQFSGSDKLLNEPISHTFDTDIITANAALQAINFSYDTSQRYVRVARMDILNVQTAGATISCSVEVELYENGATECIETSSAKVLFIAQCQ